MEFIVGAWPFMERAASDLANAQSRALAQAMTFEGDAAGTACANALIASPATDRRLIFDAYSFVILSDKLLLTNRSDAALMEEEQQTKVLLQNLQTSGVNVRMSNPIGTLGVHFPIRNHKKLIVADNISYLGGVNFSDHNFSWHDMMVRVESQELADFLSADFERSWRGTPDPQVFECEDDGAQIRIDSFRGDDNRAQWTHWRQLVRDAKEKISVISPYITFPFLDWLADAQKRGVEIEIITPDANNKASVRDYLLWEAERYGFTVKLFPEMSHMKAMRIDDDVLLLGSSNFDFVSFHAQGEYLMTIRSKDVSQQFDEVILEPDAARSTVMGPSGVSNMRGRSRRAALRIAEQAVRTAARIPGRKWIEEIR